MKKLLICIILSITCLFGFSSCNKENSESESQSQVSFVQKEIIVTVGETVKAEVLTSKENVYLFWTILDTSIATVSSKGEITGVSEGQTNCYVEFAGQTALCVVKVTKKQAKPLLSVAIAYEENAVSIYAEDTIDLGVNVKLGDTVVDGAQISYTVANTEIASVSEGKLTALKAGETTVTVTATHDGQTDTLEIAVKVVEKV